MNALMDVPLGIPLVIGDHMPPASVLLKMPALVPANNVLVVCGLMTMAATEEPAGIPAAAGLQDVPPFTLLKTPLAARPAYMLAGSIGSMASDSTDGVPANPVLMALHDAAPLVLRNA